MPSPGGCSHKPELATGEGVDTGTRAALRGKLGDRPAAGQQALAETLLADLAAIDALDTAWLDPATGTTVEVIRSAYRTALDGFALPYGDVAVGSRRNTPSAISSRSHSAPAAWWSIRDSTPSAGPARRRSTGLVETNGSGRNEVTTEVDRYSAWPGQARSYKVGHSELLRQRELAKAALGARYDLRDFNQSVVDGGNVPPDVLAGNVARYVAGAQG